MMGLLTLAALMPLCQAQRMNWFHLQDESGAWRGGHMKMAMQTFYSTMRTLSQIYDLKVGAGKFYDKGFNPFVVLTGLTDVETARKVLDREFPDYWMSHTNTTKRLLEPIKWPTTDINLPESTYSPVKSHSIDDARGCFEALIWAARHVSWDFGDDVTKEASIYVAGLPHYLGDGSWSDQDFDTNLKIFSVDLYPNRDRAIWPQGFDFNHVPYLAWNAQYASVGLVTQALAESGVHLTQVLYGLDNNGCTPKKTWERLLAQIGFETKFEYLPSVAQDEATLEAYVETFVTKLAADRAAARSEDTEASETTIG